MVTSDSGGAVKRQTICLGGVLLCDGVHPNGENMITFIIYGFSLGHIFIRLYENTQRCGYKYKNKIISL